MDSSTFRLQPLIKLREAERDERRAELAKAYQAETILQEQIRQIDTDVAAAHASRQAMSAPGKLNVDQMIEGHRYQMLLVVQRKKLLEQQQLLLQEIERRRLAVVEADRQLKILEKLKDRQAAAQMAAAHKLETRQMDEVALRSFQFPVSKSER